MWGRFTFVLAGLCCAGTLAMAEGGDCRSGETAPEMVVRVIDGRTFATSEGRVVRLAGVIVPDAFEVGAEAGQWPLNGEAQRLLTKLLVGHTVIVTPPSAGIKSDRLGRAIAQVHVVDDGTPRWVQGALIDAGLAVAVPEPAAMACIDAAMAAEARARQASAGVFATPLWRVIDLSTDVIGADAAGMFKIVRGTVQRTWRQRNGGLAVLVTSGRRKRGPAIEVELDADAVRAFAPGREGERGLLRQNVEIRGWLEAKRRGLQDGAGDQLRLTMRIGAAGGIRLAPSAPEPDVASERPALLIETGGAESVEEKR